MRRFCFLVLVLGLFAGCVQSPGPSVSVPASSSVTPSETPANILPLPELGSGGRVVRWVHDGESGERGRPVVVRGLSDVVQAA